MAEPNANLIVVELDKIALAKARMNEAVDAALDRIDNLLGEYEPAPPVPPVLFEPTPGLEVLFAHPGPVVIEDWSDAVIQDIAVPARMQGKKLLEWRYRALIEVGERTGLQNWLYLTRAPHKWGADILPSTPKGKGDVLAMVSTSANGKFILEARIDGYRGDAPNAAAKDFYGETLVLEVWYADGVLDVSTATDVSDIELENVPEAVLSQALRIQWGSGAGEPKPHATNAGSHLLGAILEVRVEGAGAQGVSYQNSSIENVPAPLAIANGVENSPSSPQTAATK
jgi:hypothetical protein